MSDMIKHPAHYVRGGIEVINVIRAFFRGHTYYYELGNITKYVLRAPHKGKFVEDLKKAREYIDQILELESVESDAVNTASDPHIITQVWEDFDDIPSYKTFKAKGLERVYMKDGDRLTYFGTESNTWRTSSYSKDTFSEYAPFTMALAV